MTKEAFHAFLIAPSTGPKLDAMLADCRITDAELESIRQKQRNEAAFIAYIRRLFDELV